ncbi:hypothetical protein ABZ714_14935 [Streptomyces sp. NPDC006798]|uniref:hypothetical protein n=1 Tax=Streptomyces sp. NPDC006798 TaxID=3155462 RepID=UPI0033F45530
MSNAFLQSIPEVTVTPTSGDIRSTSATPEAPRPAKTGGFQRRTFLRTTMAGAATLAVTGLGWVGGGSAYAFSRTSRHPAHCMSVDVPGDTPCWGRQYISSVYCASDGYHRTDTETHQYWTRKYGWEAACGGYAGWYWRMANGRTVHCWDGYFEDIKLEGSRTRFTTSCKSG